MFGLPIPIIGLIIAVFILVFLVLKLSSRIYCNCQSLLQLRGLIGGMSCY